MAGAPEAGTRTDTQVVVVGAGPVGLMLAGELRLGGVDVVVVESRTDPTTESRASTLHARTMEILAARGLLDRFGSLPNHTMGHFGGIPLDLTLPGPYPGQWKAPQARTETILQDWALALGARLERGHELTGLTLRQNMVEAEVSGPAGPVRISALYVVGCDGEQSTVRRLVGAEFPGRDAGRELIRADVDGIEIPARHFQRLERGLAIAARDPRGVTRVMVHEFGSAAGRRAGDPEFADIRDAWRRVTGEDISHGVPIWVNAFGDASRQLTRYRHGRVLFAGDAAHQQMPIGGQALNLGLQDAVNLGWKLALQVGGRAPAGLLDSYHTERHAVGRQVLKNIEAQAMLLLGGPEVEATRSVLAELIAHEPARQQLAGVISGLTLGSRSPLGARLAHDHPMRSGRGLLIDTYGDPEHHARLRTAAAPWADRVDTVAAEPDSRGPLPGPDAVLVRPDGHVAWIASAGPPGPQPLVAALRTWFGEPAHLGQASTGQNTPVERRHHMSRLNGKTALVTGSSRGIGRAIATRLAREGALVAVHGSSGVPAAEDVVASIEKEGGRAFVVQAELGIPGDVHELFLALEQGLKERTGSVDLDIVVNNAGVMGGVSVEDTTQEKFDRLFAVNARAPFFVIQRALTNLTEGGRIINISSGLTRVANPDEIAYAMTKGALEQLALHFARFLAPRGITVNSVAPGITRNGSPVFDIPEAVEQMAQLSAFGRVGEPQDIADVVAFLASDDARWVTGAFIDASGGTLLG
ncbi:SDR family oxidoreductase [Streptomyces sp. B21-083]|uniref:SDR family oxidoreductase n=1 Tax=Streptomyces sp. B21-083 TaxID=3039410 RepID=UPI002FF05603